MHVLGRADSKLASALVQRYCLQLKLFFNVYSLQDMIGAVENDEGIAGDVGLNDAM